MSSHQEGRHDDFVLIEIVNPTDKSAEYSTYDIFVTRNEALKLFLLLFTARYYRTLGRCYVPQDLCSRRVTTRRDLVGGNDSRSCVIMNENNSENSYLYCKNDYGNFRKF